MDPTHSASQPAPNEPEPPLDSHAAALLVDQTSRAARHQLDPTPPVLSFVLLLANGALRVTWARRQ